MRLLTVKHTMEFLNFVLLIKFAYATIYKGDGINETFRTEEIIFEEDDIPSKLNCAHKCLRFKAEMLYEGTKCRCVKRSLEHQDDSNPNHLEVTGLYYSPTEIIPFKPEHEPWKRYQIFGEEIKMETEYVRTFDRFTRQFTLNIELKMTSFENADYFNVLRFASQNDIFKMNSHSDLIPRVRSYDNNYKQMYLKWHKFLLNKWVSWKISQLKQPDGKYVFKVERNGKEAESYITNKPRSFENVKLFLSNRYTKPAQPEFVRNMWIEFDNEELTSN